MKKVLIYKHCEKIFATKPETSYYPNQKFVHSFNRSKYGNVNVFGLPNGDILLKSEKGFRLWDFFEQ